MKNFVRTLFFPIALLLIITSYAQAQDARTISDTNIEAVHIEDLSYPALASRFTQGVVVVRVKLDKEGKVVDAAALSGSTLLTRASAQNAKKWRFRPNSESAAIVVYDFRIKGSCVPGHPSSQMIFYPPNFVTITVCGLATEP